MSGNKIQKIEHLNTGAISKNLRVIKLSISALNLGENKISAMQDLDGLENLRILNLSTANIT